MSPKISIITITYNSEKTLEETILSVLSQNYENFEYLIIDGGSRDSTLEIVNKYRDNIAVVVSEPDHGISDAFNKGIKYATGEIIGIINSDDLLMPGALTAIANHYDPSIDVYSGNVIFWNEDTGDEFSSKPEISFDKLRLQYSVAHPGRFITKTAYEKYGCYSVELRYNMDIDLLCRFYKQGAHFIHIDEDFAKFRMGGTTADSIYKKKEDYRLFIKNYGGSNWDFKKIWIKAVIKYNLIRLSTLLLGESFRFRYYKFRRRFF
jgi:glycosyltransferase involved in cell wall biosynthesis